MKASITYTKFPRKEEYERHLRLFDLSIEPPYFFTHTDVYIETRHGQTDD